jgi:hypothetical protein
VVWKQITKLSFTIGIIKVVRAHHQATPAALRYSVDKDHEVVSLRGPGFVVKLGFKLFWGKIA